MKSFLILFLAVFLTVPVFSQVLSGYQGNFVYDVPTVIPAGIDATGSFTLSAGNASSANTLTLGGTAITFVTSGASGNQVNIGGTNLITIASLLSFLQGSADSNLVKCTYAALGNNGVTLTSVLPGIIGNSFTLAKSAANITLSGANLTGGAQAASNVIDLRGFSLAGILLPAALISTALTFEASVDGTNFFAVKNTTSGTALSYTVAQGNYYAINPVDFYGIRYLKIVPGSPEGSARTLTLALKGF